MKQRFEREDTAEPSKIPMPERLARLEAQKTRLPGLHYSSETEPSHKLVDTVFQMLTDQEATWIPWEKLTTRASEAVNNQKDLQITFDASGSLKLSKKLGNESKPAGETKVHQALARRARAFDLAQICDFVSMEAWHEKLFETLMRDPLPNCNAISMQQLKEADLWRKLSEKTRGNIAQQATGAKPVQLQLITLTVDPEVHFLLLPTSRPQTRPGPYDKDPKPGKGDKKGKGKGKDQPFQLPQGCHQKTEQGKPICNSYNKGFCKFAADGKRCKRGFHVCWTCFKPQPYSKCCGSA